jgi:hypothetical protein
MKEYRMKKTSILFIVCTLSLALLASGSAIVHKKAATTAKAGFMQAPEARAFPSALPTGWKTPENISKNGLYSEGPYAALDAKGNAYVSWVDWYGGVGADRAMKFSTNKSGAWGTPRTNMLQYVAIDDVGFPQVAVTQNGNNALYAWMDGYFSLGRMVVAGEELANGVWSGAGVISNQVSDPSTYPTIYASPVDNTMCFVWQQDMNPGFAMAYQYRDGVTGAMSSPTLMTAAQAGGQYLPNIFVDSKGTVHCAYTTRAFEAIIWYTKNANAKNTSGWTTPIAISGGTGLDWSYPMVAATHDGDAYIVWQEDHSGLEEIYLRYQKNGVWQSTQTLTNTAAPSEHPSIAVNPVTKEIYISWLELTGGGLGNIYLKTYEVNKTTGAFVWSDNIQVTTSGQAQKSCIRVTNEGDIHLVYADSEEIWYTMKLAPPPLTAIQPPTVSSKINRVLFSSEKTLTINFAKNPVNDDATLKEYRLYYKKAEEANTAYTVLATFAPTAALQYVMKKLPVSQKYNFMASVVNKDGLEIKTTAVLSD